MPDIQLELEVIGGPDKGRIFRVSGATTIIGRDQECHIRLNDPTVSNKHARLEIGNETAQVVDLGSINKVQHNGNSVTKALLSQGDRIGIGDTTIEVTIRNTSAPLDMQQSVRTGRRKGALLLVASSLVLLLIFVYYGVNYQKEKQKQQTPVVINTLRGIKTLGFRGLPQVNLPVPGDFSDRPTNNYMPKDKDAPAPRPYFYSFQSAVRPGAKKGGYQDRSELATASVLPPDPFSNLVYRNRNWSNYNPRLGNGRLIKGEQPLVLGNYYVSWVSYDNDQLYNETPPGLIGKSAGYDAKLGEKAPIHFDFYIEVWDSLPTSAPIQVVSLDLKSPDMRFASKPRIPKMLGALVDRAKWTKFDNNQQWADFTMNIGDQPYMHYMMRQEKKGESLAIFTGRDYAFQADRVDEAIRMLVEKQNMTPPKRKEDNEALIANALDLEKEADKLIPDLMTYKMAELDYYKDKWNFFRAFNRYHRALCLLQVADKWAFDDDYLRIFSKAEKIYDYCQSESGFFMQSWKEIERLRDNRDWKGAQKKNDELYQFATLGMEPEEFVFLDEWFVYSHLVREQTAKNIISDR